MIKPHCPMCHRYPSPDDGCTILTRAGPFVVQQPCGFEIRNPDARGDDIPSRRCGMSVPDEGTKFKKPKRSRKS